MDEQARLTQALADRYRIEGKIGAGGMATVFLAQDLRHDRRVAIKVLRPELSAVLGTERFLTEIKVTANLQHPHILPLHDSGEADGVLFYVMPYVEGESLRDRLQRETQLSIEDAFQITQEVADGLSYAHGLGVIHRDIKPENILLSGGHALIADFGIARAVTEAGGSRLTETGLSLGTPHYMSPEQAAGEREVDARSDEYALGCVLFEMLVGEPPYTGPNAQAIIAKVLTEPPPSPRKSRELLSPQADAAIGVALAKLPADRFPSVEDFSEALRRAGSGGWETAGGYGAPRTHSHGMGSWGARLAWSLVGVLAALGVGILLWPQAPPTSGLRAMARATLMPRPADSISLGVLASTTSGAEVGTLAISHDGRRVAFVGKARGEDATYLFVRSLEHSGASRLSGTESAASPFFSPDGEWLGFYSWTDGRLKKVPVSGGAPQVICECDPILTADWGPHGTIVMDGSGFGGLRLVDAGGGTPELAVPLEEHKVDPEYAFQHPHFLPDGRSVLFSAWGGDGATRRLAMFSFDTGERTTLFQDGWAPRYVDTGHILFLRTDQIWALPFDMDRLEAGATALPVVDSVNAVQFQTLFGVSDNGTLVYAPGPAPEWGNRAYLVDHSGQRELLFPEEGSRSIAGPTFSPDGSRIAFSGTDLTGYSAGQATPRIWIHDILRGTTEALLESGPGDFWPIWAPDGRSVVFTTARSGEGFDLFRAWVDGSGEGEAIYTDGSIKNAHSWLPDGTGLIFQSAPDFESDFDIWLLPMEGDGAPAPLVQGPGNDVHPALSPDGRWLAYASDQSGRYEVYLRRYPELDDPRRVSGSGGMGPLWREDGREFYYYQQRTGSDNQVTFLKVPVDDEPGTPEPLWSSQLPGLGLPYGKGYDVTPDGQKMLVDFIEGDVSLFVPELRIVFNWFDGLKARFER